MICNVSPITIPQVVKGSWTWNLPEILSFSSTYKLAYAISFHGKFISNIKKKKIIHLIVEYSYQWGQKQSVHL